MLFKDITMVDENFEVREHAYVGVKGDCLWTISQKFYGTGMKWNSIYQANTNVIKNPDIISIGMSLIIPD